MRIRRLRRTALVVLAAACLGLTPPAWAAPESARRGERPEPPSRGLFSFVQQTWSLLPTLWDLLDPTTGCPSGGQEDVRSPHTEGSGIDPDGGRHP